MRHSQVASTGRDTAGWTEPARERLDRLGREVLGRAQPGEELQDPEPEEDDPEPDPVVSAR